MTYLNRKRMLKISGDYYVAVACITSVYQRGTYDGTSPVRIALEDGRDCLIDDGRTLEQVLQEINDAV